MRPSSRCILWATSSPNDYRRDRRAYRNCALLLSFSHSLSLFHLFLSSSLIVYSKLCNANGSLAQGSAVRRTILRVRDIASNRARIKVVHSPIRVEWHERVLRSQSTIGHIAAIRKGRPVFLEPLVRVLRIRERENLRDVVAYNILQLSLESQLRIYSFYLHLETKQLVP